MRATLSVLLAAAALVAILPGAQAQLRCPEGRTSAGECVNPALAQVMRKSAIINAQPKISYTAPPLLPSEDGTYLLPRDHHEAANLYYYPPVIRSTTLRP
ncbi:MAG: hypothetical protein JOZ70_03645 [Pseudolabrys sp.]|nr:hypothetical protein [Pseudolabrys sp.]MBV9954324.1 hypothetical protein [Pseudolabrys sp.]